MFVDTEHDQHEFGDDAREDHTDHGRPDVGFVKFRFELVNATDQPVMTLIVSPMFGRRAPDSARGRGPKAASER